MRISLTGCGLYQRFLYRVVRTQTELQVWTDVGMIGASGWNQTLGSYVRLPAGSLEGCGLDVSLLSPRALEGHSSGNDDLLVIERLYGDVRVSLVHVDRGR